METGSPEALQSAKERMANVERLARESAPHRPWMDTVKQLRAAAAKNQRAFDYLGLASILNHDREQAGCGSDEAGSLFLQLVLYHAATDIVNEAFVAHVRIPESIRTLLHGEARRIIGDLADGSRMSYRTDSEPFMQDLGLVTGRLLPAGAELIELHRGVERRTLLKGGFRQFVRGVLYFVVQRRGFFGYCAFHMDPRHLEDFNPEGWHKTYLRIAELLELNPELLGVFGATWFYDPAVTDISPHLAYLRKDREAGGARNFRFGPTPWVNRYALAKSGKRKLLHEQGRYNPEVYILVWHRRELLEWANQEGVHGSI